MRTLWVVAILLTGCLSKEEERPEQMFPAPLSAEHQATLDSIVDDVGAYRDSIFQRLYPNPREIPNASEASDAEILGVLLEMERVQRLDDIRTIRMLCWASANCDIDCPYRRTRCLQRSSDD